MSETTIEWCDYTFNPWRGCTHVSPGCEHCYAEALSKRYRGRHGTWGADGERVVASEAYWRQPVRWNAAAAAAGERRRVFCASLADVFEDRPELVAPRDRLLGLIAATPSLDWLLLTKRPENAARLVAAIVGEGEPWPANVWLGASAEDQRRADERIPLLLETPAAMRFVSAEPLLGAVDLSGWLGNSGADSSWLDWLIVGGESGPGARPMYLGWAESLVDQCRHAGVPVFVKQLGARPFDYYPRYVGAQVQEFDSLEDAVRPLGLRDRKGGDPEEWPWGLRVREWPR